MRRTLIYIGREFYEKSGSIMSFLYETSKKRYIRTDFGKMQQQIEAGDTITIRPATMSELSIFNARLKNIVCVDM